MKTAVILFNLGGPDNLQNVKPFLFNLFNDKAIIGLPQPFRWMLAKFISSKREEKAQKIYSQIGGKSPIVELTQQQATALEAELGEGFKVFVAMRYWHPFSAETASQVAEYAPDNVVLLPLYPQFSTTTTESSFKDWKLPANKKICCYHSDESFIAAHAEMLAKQVKKFPQARVLFSAHGLPEKVIKAGDPYQWQVEQTSRLVAEKLGLADWRVCYQSKVGPLPWLKPNTEDEIRAAAADGKDIILTPIAFVSEHSETLVELDIQFKELAEEVGIKNYIRIPALGTNATFIKCLAELVKGEEQRKTCPADFCKCQKSNAKCQ